VEDHGLVCLDANNANFQKRAVAVRPDEHQHVIWPLDGPNRIADSVAHVLIRDVALPCRLGDPNGITRQDSLSDASLSRFLVKPFARLIRSFQTAEAKPHAWRMLPPESLPNASATERTPGRSRYVLPPIPELI